MMGYFWPSPYAPFFIETENKDNDDALIIIGNQTTEVNIRVDNDNHKCRIRFMSVEERFPEFIIREYEDVEDENTDPWTIRMTLIWDEIDHVIYVAYTDGKDNHWFFTRLGTWKDIKDELNKILQMGVRNYINLILLEVGVRWRV